MRAYKQRREHCPSEELSSAGVDVFVQFLYIMKPRLPWYAERECDAIIQRGSSGDLTERTWSE